VQATGRRWRGRWRQGDVLVVTRLDRLARSTRDLLNVLDAIGGAGAGFKSLADTWADTTTPHGRLMLTVQGGPAEFECELIKPAPARGESEQRLAGCIWAGPRRLRCTSNGRPLARREAVRP
jgi:DNA invertase Pin-like site-specific DNA recombinase